MHTGSNIFILRVALMSSMLFFFPMQVSAQKLHNTLEEVKVKQKRKKTNQSNDERVGTFSPGMKTVTIDSALMRQYALQNLATLLSQQVPVFIKSYGINSMATLNFRGASSAQSQVYWNGIPLNNASLGMTDVSLLQVSLFDKIHIVYGSSAAMWGSGNVGGALLLENDQPHFDTIRHSTSGIALEAGSYRQYKTSLHHTFSSKRWYIDARMIGVTAENDFVYKDMNGASKRMSNAHTKGISTIVKAAYKIDNSSAISLSAWYQLYEREIPPALFEHISEKRQQDASLRLLLDWKKQHNISNVWYAKGAFVKDDMHYEDNQVALNATNMTCQYYQELGWKHVFNKNNELLLFMPFNFSWMKVPGDSQYRYQDKVAIAAAYKVKAFNEKLQVAVNARAERINTEHILLPGINLSYTLCSFLELRANAQRTYRAPTLNELYYNPGGNSTLRPEQGWHADAGYRLNSRIAKQLILIHDLSIYNREIQDWILWFGGSIWTPHNIATVRSRGIETTNSLHWLRGDWKWHLGVNTSFVLSTTTSSYIPNDGSIGKQIPYTPRYNGQLNIGSQYKCWYFNYNHTYTSYRFITTDESQSLSPYSTGNVYLSCSLPVRQHHVDLSFHVNNIWNEQYQVVNLRPMPGRNWLFGAGYIF